MIRGSSKAPALVAFAMAGLCACMLVMLLTGCAPQPKPLIKSATFTVNLLSERPAVWSPTTAGVTTWYPSGRTVVDILEEYYPECVTHEVRHVFEKEWHDQRTTCR